MLHIMPIRILHDHGYLMAMVLAYNAHSQRISTWTLECQVQFAAIMDNDNDQVNWHSTQPFKLPKTSKHHSSIMRENISTRTGIRWRPYLYIMRWYNQWTCCFQASSRNITICSSKASELPPKRCHYILWSQSISMSPFTWVIQYQSTGQ